MYVTQTGTVYHREYTCTHLELSIRSVAEAEIAARKKAQAENINDIDDDDDRTQQEVTEIPDFSSIESIEKMGMEKLKEILQSMGAKCGYVIMMSIN